MQECLLNKRNCKLHEQTKQLALWVCTCRCTALWALSSDHGLKE